MKCKDIKPGMQVVLNDNDDATMYLVRGLHGFTAIVQEMDVARATPQEIDCSLLQIPTLRQLTGE